MDGFLRPGPAAAVVPTVLVDMEAGAAGATTGGDAAAALATWPVLAASPS